MLSEAGGSLMPSKETIVLGSRGSRLALWQANHLKRMMESQYPQLKIMVKVIQTTGDKVKKTPLAEIGGKYLFLKEIEEAILAEKVDIGVHSMKDVPAVLPAGLTIGAILKREDPRDAFVSKKFDSLLQLPKKSKVGTSSFRRQAQLRNFRPDLEGIPLRGNVESRLRKLTEGKLAAVILAAAGLIRLGMGGRITEALPTTLMLPAVGQGAIGLELREGDSEKLKLVEFLSDYETTACLTAERSFLSALQGDCRSPIAAFAEVDGINLKLTGMVATPDGRELIRDRVEGSIREAQSLGEQLAKALFSQGAREILRASSPLHK